MATQEQAKDQACFLKANCLVAWPQSDALALSPAEFYAYLAKLLKGPTVADKNDDVALMAVVPVPGGTIAEQFDPLKRADDSVSNTAEDSKLSTESHTLDNASSVGEQLSADTDSTEDAQPGNTDNLMLTENGDVAFRSTQSALVDLFYELEEVVSGPRLRELLNAAWKDDPLVALKIIFNSRSIHLGKGSRSSFYRCAGWLAEQHPLTLIANLRWLSRPVIQKKLEKKDEDLADLVVVEPEKDESDVTRFDVRNGVAHGYWKDLLNILALSVNKRLTVLANPADILNVAREKSGTHKDTPDAAKVNRQALKATRHTTAVDAFLNDPIHQALHLAITCLFAEQLKSDIALLRSKDSKAKKGISLCAKWAPSTARFHDNNTFIVSSIAEMLYPAELFTGIIATTGNVANDRTLYLRHAREAYRRDIAALRKHLDIVERNISAKTFSDIHYERVPSVAMKNYSTLFVTKDTDRFESYIDKVAAGTSQISGAVLLPSALIKAVRGGGSNVSGKSSYKRILNSRMSAIQEKVVDGQWGALVQRIKDSGTMASSVAVCDVSGSMLNPTFADGTCPMDSAIGLSLLIAEAAKPPHGGAIITFSATPAMHTVDLTQTLREKYDALTKAQWGMNTDFEAVFTKLILPNAVEAHLPKEDMIKRVFVFSDMQFDEANREEWDDQGPGARRDWYTCYERIEAAFKSAGYDVPELVFWNLAGGRAGYAADVVADGDPVAPKPAEADTKGVALVSGYSQGMLKTFLFDEDAEEEEGERDVVMEDEDGEEGVVEVRREVTNMTPLNVVMKAVKHKAYDMLRVID
ncbi:hypothetical protein B0T22DRAFT_474364 [Podospora appendiculata]|uniref:DUF2828 domain-containing protein n=1 Tax=Podospora appendiculata TaxID=314037 RepID=A0AAE1C6Z9_9PEZI|nr:hypothetical protein B0T22DRAFT_474364 [Podospora appendiculata]